MRRKNPCDVRSLSETRYDYIIVGGGSAGCVLANRLSEDRDVTVLLLEAGGRDRSMFVRMPAGLPFVVNDPSLNWGYEAGPEPELHGRMLVQPRGKLLGGTSSINGMTFVRGDRSDYDNWASHGLEGWGWENCLPYFKKLESFDRGSNVWRGDSGPLRVSTAPADDFLFERFFRAGEQAGFGYTDDHNGEHFEGFHRAQATVGDGVRSSTSNAYLRPAYGRANLVVATSARAKLLNFEGNTASGVSLVGDDRKFVARREVIVCAGAIGSPHLLNLSGVGDADTLESLGISVVQHLPGVGKNLQDHISAGIKCRTSEKVSWSRHLGPLGRFRVGAEWLILKRGLGASNFFEAGAFLCSEAGVNVPDMQFEFLPLLPATTNGNLSIEAGFQLFSSLTRPESVGEVKTLSPSPSVNPRIVFNRLQVESDRRDLVRLVRVARHLLAQPAWSGTECLEISPGPEIKSDAEILEWLRWNCNSQHHPCGTCRMGSDDFSVVDEAGRVRGLRGIRVVDASIMPRIITGNINAPVIMMAEKIADTIKGKQKGNRGDANADN